MYKDIKEKIGIRPVVIGKNCFIGCNSIVKKGMVLGDSCIVGAGAIVSGKFEDNFIIVGNLPRVIKKIKEKI